MISPITFGLGAALVFLHEAELSPGLFTHDREEDTCNQIGRFGRWILFVCSLHKRHIVSFLGLLPLTLSYPSQPILIFGDMTNRLYTKKGQTCLF